jgi:hypothetical protein
MFDDLIEQSVCLPVRLSLHHKALVQFENVKYKVNVCFRCILGGCIRDRMMSFVAFRFICHSLLLP